MKRLICFMALAFVIFSAIIAFAEAEITPEIKVELEDVTIEYSPNGYMPEATFTYPLSSSDIHYLAVDKLTSEPVELPLTNAGEYVVKAYAMLGEMEISDMANVTITPVIVTISVPYDKLRYTGEPIIPEYTVYPEWTAEYFQINVTYTYYKDNSPNSTKHVDAPNALGKYYVKMTPYGIGNNIECDGKAYILTIAESRGQKLSESKANAPLGSGIMCDLEDVEMLYNGEASKINYTVKPSCAMVELYYRLIGSSDEPTTTPPVEPGEYEVTAVICNQVLDRGTLIIKKRIPKYNLETVKYKYTPSGVVPYVTSADSNAVEFSISAYLVNENDELISSESLPLKKVGKYLLIINPTDTTHYEALYSPEYIYIEKCVPVISSAARNYEYDGFSKEISYDVTPTWLRPKCEIEYFEVDSQGNVKSSLGDEPPINVGKYIAEIKVKESENNEETSLKVHFEIEPSSKITVSRPEESETEYMFLGIATTEFVLAMIAVPLSLIVLFVVFVVVQRKKERK